MRAHRTIDCTEGAAPPAAADAPPPIPFFDPHFHLWDLSAAKGVTPSGHDATNLFKPTAHGDVYSVDKYESDVAPATRAGTIAHVGGVFLEATSVCHTGPEADGKSPALDGAQLNTRACVPEAAWALSTQLHPALGKTGKRYVVVASCALEAPNAGDTLQQLARQHELSNAAAGSAAPGGVSSEAAIPGLRNLAPRVVGVRQIVNHEPSWPRNGALGDLLDSAAWRAGFARLKDVGFSFDLQLNPHQFAKAAAFLAGHPATPVIINHLGSPTLPDLAEEAKAKVYWDGLAALAALPHVFIKLSMLCYTAKEWTAEPLVVAAVQRVIGLFGPARCMFASNFPVDCNLGHPWPAARLCRAWLDAVCAPLDLGPRQVRALFAETAMNAYQVPFDAPGDGGEIMFFGGGGAATAVGGGAGAGAGAGGGGDGEAGVFSHGTTAKKKE